MNTSQRQQSVGKKVGGAVAIETSSAGLMAKNKLRDQASKSFVQNKSTTISAAQGVDPKSAVPRPASHKGQNDFRITRKPSQVFKEKKNLIDQQQALRPPTGKSAASNLDARSNADGQVKKRVQFITELEPEGEKAESASRRSAARLGPAATALALEHRTEDSNSDSDSSNDSFDLTEEEIA